MTTGVDRDELLAKFDEKLAVVLEKANLTGAVSKRGASDPVKKITGADFTLSAPKSLHYTVIETKDSIIVADDDGKTYRYSKIN